jgi:hypothetical protein
MHYYPGGIRRPVFLGSENSRLAGTGRVADDLCLIARHEATGRSYLPPRAQGIAIAGGLLAELLDAVTPSVTLAHGCLLALTGTNGCPAARHARPDEPVTARVLGLIAAESPPRPVGDWLLFVGRTAAAEVTGRLERCGYLTRPAGRIPGRARRPVPVEADWATCALLRARAALDASRPPAPYPALLAGLATACGLGFRLSNLATASDRSVEDATRILPPVLRELIARVQVTADAAVLSGRK